MMPIRGRVPPRAALRAMVSITSGFNNGASAIADDGSVITFSRSQISFIAP